MKQSKLKCRGRRDCKFLADAGLICNNAFMALTTVIVYGIEFVSLSHPEVFIVELRARCKRDLAGHFIALFCRFTFVYVMMSGISIGVMLSFTLYIKS
jgi:hypothetical protein